MKYLTFAVLCLAVGAAYAFYGSSSGFDHYPQSPEEVLKQDPEHAADKAIANGDFSLLMVPDCFMGLPGYQGSAPPQTAPKILGKSCEELFGDTAKDIEKLKEWARRYNGHIQERQHNNQLNKDASR